MKMTKKFLLGGAVLLAATMMFTGCPDGPSGLLQKTFGEDIFYYDDANYNSGLGTWTVKNKENESKDSYVRGVKLLLTKHTDIAGRVKIGNDEVTSNGAGVLGIAFNVSQNEDDTWNFGLVGLRNYGNNPTYYISFFYNIKEDDMAGNNFGASEYNENTKEYVAIKKETYDANVTTPYEVQIKDFTKINVLNNNILSAVVDIDETNDGGYTISFYSEDAIKDHIINENAKSITNVEIAATKIGKTEPKQAYVGVYGNIYPAADAETPRTMYGELEILDLTNYAIIAD